MTVVAIVMNVVRETHMVCYRYPKHTVSLSVCHGDPYFFRFHLFFLLMCWSFVHCAYPMTCCDKDPLLPYLHLHCMSLMWQDRGWVTAGVPGIIGCVGLLVLLLGSLHSGAEKFGLLLAGSLLSLVFAVWMLVGWIVVAVNSGQGVDQGPYWSVGLRIAFTALASAFMIVAAACGFSYALRLDVHGYQDCHKAFWHRAPPHCGPFGTNPRVYGPARTVFWDGPFGAPHSIAGFRPPEDNQMMRHFTERGISPAVHSIRSPNQEPPTADTVIEPPRTARTPIPIPPPLPRTISAPLTANIMPPIIQPAAQLPVRTFSVGQPRKITVSRPSLLSKPQ